MHPLQILSRESRQTRHIDRIIRAMVVVEVVVYDISGKPSATIEWE